jgi:hypothetical protein
MDFDLKLEPNGSFAILTNYKDVTLPSVIERQRAMKMFAEEYGDTTSCLIRVERVFPERMWTCFGSPENST